MSDHAFRMYLKSKKMMQESFEGRRATARLRIKSGVRNSVRRQLLEAARQAILAADPRTIIGSTVQFRNGILNVGDSQSFNLKGFERVFVLGGGKAAGPMAREVERILGDRITSGLVNIPDYLKMETNLSNIKLNKASHPIPDSRGVGGVQRMLKLVQHPKEQDFVICLISGGASALLPLPASGMTLEDKQEVTTMLLKSGANIDEINTVRKHLSAIKGGRLAEKLKPATVLSLIISDVVGDRVDSIASGPTAPDETSYNDAESVLKKYALWSKIPLAARLVIKRGLAGKLEETPKAKSKLFDHVHNVIVGSNKHSCETASRFLRKSGYKTLLLSTQIQGEAQQVGKVFSAILSDVRESGIPVAPPFALIAGGETTVTVRGSGLGGRNQELALSVALGISGLKKVGFVSIGTDGVDGPTNSAGAYVDGQTIKRGLAMGMDAKVFLNNNDSNHFFEKLGDLIKTGPTGTNVNDIMIALAAKD